MFSDLAADAEVSETCEITISYAFRKGFEPILIALLNLCIGAELVDPSF